MSDLAHNTPATLPVRLRPSRFIRFAAALLVLAAIVVAVVLFSADDGSSSSPAAVAPAASSVNQPAGVRYDGGPEEGTRGPATSAPSLDTRYDGGPEEGTRGLGR